MGAFNMDPESAIDYQAVLEDLQAKRAELDAAISAVKRILGYASSSPEPVITTNGGSANGGSVVDAGTSTNRPPVVDQTPADDRVFFKMSIAEEQVRPWYGRRAEPAPCGRSEGTYDSTGSLNSMPDARAESSAVAPGPSPNLTTTRPSLLTLTTHRGRSSEWIVGASSGYSGRLPSALTRQP